MTPPPVRVKICGQVFTGTIDQIRENKDGTLELITATHCGLGATANQLAVWSARDGALLGRKPLGEAACGVAAQSFRDGDARILVGQSRSGGLEFRWREGRITQSAALVTGAGLAMVSRADVLPGEPGDELVAVDVHDRLTVLGSDLRVLASDIVPRSSTKLWCEPWRLAEDLPAIVDLVLLDGHKPLYEPVLELLLPRLRRGASIVADNAAAAPAYLERVRSPGSGFVSVLLADDVEWSVWMDRAQT